MTHAELQEALQALSIDVGAAEAHGWLCGALCVQDRYGPADWVRDLAADSGRAGAPAAPRALSRLHQETADALGSPQFEFAPLLPGDDAPLAERVNALAAWCGGFLYGIGSHAGGRDLGRTGDVGEYLGDLARIARAKPGAGRLTDADEADFSELFEFVRAGTQLAWVELAPARGHAR